MLVERPMHPYEMFSLLKERHEDHIVKVRPGSLYHTVERLARDGLAVSCGTAKAGNRPERTTYEITQVGRAVLSEQVSVMLDSPVNEYPRFPLALGESHNLPRDQVVGHLTHRAERLTEMVDEADRYLAGLRESDVPEAYWFVADYLRTIQAAERDWLRALIIRLHNEELPWPYRTTDQ
ncbi:PadR family transcriptional regulator [Streptomyces montanisoli]|uniref:Helix-turn-helix transcriptional regulator n=1 Tax=Streptomyces montanisoli TaxID=2798581 RepID=A0A940MFS0_9ACTN|nr:helix-turn-helix transcriptional regulator [Streptomyces montanisoli]MBP0457818.1 helix-turn-helix transcriptional regulator [Streptomyces montanisoli]